MALPFLPGLLSLLQILLHSPLLISQSGCLLIFLGVCGLLFLMRDGCDIVFHFLQLSRNGQTLCPYPGRRFIQKVNGFIRQKTILDIAV